MSNYPIYFAQTGEQYVEEEWVDFTLINCGPRSLADIFDNQIHGPDKNSPDNVKLECILFIIFIFS
jgi:hypothetical protein